MTTDISTEKPYITQYLEDLKMCLDRACRCEEEKMEAEAMARIKYNRSVAYYGKVKVYWDNIQTTNDHALDVKAALWVLQCVCEKLETYVCCDLDAIKFLTSKVKELSADLETYLCCVVKLCDQIDKICKKGFKKDNPIVVALTELKAKYEAAITLAVQAVCDVFAALEEICFLKLKMKGDPDGNIEECLPDPKCCDEDDESDDSCWGLELCIPDPPTTVPDPCDPPCDCKDRPPSTHPELCEGIKDNCELIWTLWSEHFPLNDDSGGEVKCAFWVDTKTEYDNAKCAVKCNQEKLEEAVQYKNLAMSQKASVQSSYEQAKAATKC